MASRRVILFMYILQISYHSIQSTEGNILRHYRSEKYNAQVTFDGNANVINCQWTENGHNSATSNVDAELVTDSQMKGFIRSCKALKDDLQSPQDVQRRNLLIASGTKWCGAGNTAKNYEDLGEHSATDSCCRSHDHCDLNIGAMQRAHGLFNFAVVTRSGCHCEEEFLNCMKNAAKTESIAAQIGVLYFNILNLDCIKEVPKRKCVSKFLGICTKTVEVPGETEYGFVDEDMRWSK